MSADTISLELLDADGTRVVQCWEFRSPGVLQIGRSRECDVVVGSPYVSRSHAYVSPCPEGYKLCVISQQGVYVEEKKLEQFILSEGLAFRLGAHGPTIRVRFKAFEVIQSDTSTIAFEPGSIPFLLGDQPPDFPDFGAPAAASADEDTLMVPGPAKTPTIIPPPQP